MINSLAGINMDVFTHFDSFYYKHAFIGNTLSYQERIANSFFNTVFDVLELEEENKKDFKEYISLTV
ncbi:hypothetical protein [Flavivirga eckloniae]|uniref:Uncharacterized protein n=1 Tax=Flavivirga eckloniae TaxID=1803846 RepID=A0A2K9PR44_9FLAO|nr:hypothetical protein [Flavivirga eckloniae]AUP79543.1 hypothetical protein C1H87_12825 [Flavivirga eckloniae]